MLALFSSIKHLVDEGLFIFEGEFKGKLTDLKEKSSVFFQERVEIDDYFIPKRIYLEPEWDGNFFTVSFNLHDAENDFTDDSLWDFYVSYENKIEKVESHLNEPFKMENFFVVNSFYEAKAYITKFKTFAFSVKAIDLSPRLVDGHVDNERLTSIFTIAENNISEHHIEIIFRKRIQPDLLYHQEELVFPVFKTEEGQYSSSMDLSTLVSYENQSPKTIWDIFIRVQINTLSTVQALLTDKKGGYLRKIHHISPYKDVYFYRNFKNTLSAAVSTPDKNLVFVTCIKEQDGEILLEGKINGFFVRKVVLYKDSAFEDADLSIDILELTFTQKEEGFTAAVSIESLRDQIHLSDEDKYFLKIEISDNEIDMVVPIYFDESYKPSKNTFIVNNDYQILLEKTEHEEGAEPSPQKVMFKIKQKTLKPTDHSIKIAISGSCFSRLAFSSNDYYNPGYKNRYDVVHTQFHSSVLSIMSNPVEFPEEKFQGFNPREVNYIRGDFTKDFFEKLNETQPDFLIVDFYVDGSKDVILFDEDHIITVNYMLRRNVNYLYEISSKAKVLTHKNIETYLSYWKPAVEEYARKIVEIVPEDRIILQKVRKTEGYITEHGSVERFSDAANNIKRSNYLYEYMENYFLKLLPSVQTIDLSNGGYYSHHEHPESVTPDHYEPGYYKEYMKRLDENILRYLINNPSYLHKKNKKWFW